MTEKAVSEFDAFCKLLSVKLESLSPQHQKIARFMMENPHETALETASGIADQLNVQPSSLVRLARILGYSGISDIQKIFKEHTRTQLCDITDCIRDPATKQNNRHISARDVLDQFIYANIASLRHLQRNINAQKFSRAIKILEQARRTYILGTRCSYPAASYMFDAFARLRQPAYLLDGVGGFLNQQAENIQKNDALMVFAFPPYAEETFEATKLAKEKGAKIVSVTDSPIAPVMEFSDCNFNCDKTMVNGSRPITGSLCIAQAISVKLGVDVSKSVGSNRLFNQHQ